MATRLSGGSGATGGVTSITTTDPDVTITPTNGVGAVTISVAAGAGTLPLPANDTGYLQLNDTQTVTGQPFFHGGLTSDSTITTRGNGVISSTSPSLGGFLGGGATFYWVKGTLFSTINLNPAESLLAGSGSLIRGDFGSETAPGITFPTVVQGGLFTTSGNLDIVMGNNGKGRTRWFNNGKILLGNNKGVATGGVTISTVAAQGPIVSISSDSLLFEITGASITAATPITASSGATVRSSFTATGLIGFNSLQYLPQSTSGQIVLTSTMPGFGGFSLARPDCMNGFCDGNLTIGSSWTFTTPFSSSGTIPLGSPTTWYWPVAYGSSGQFLQVDGSGHLTAATPASGNGAAAVFTYDGTIATSYSTFSILTPFGIVPWATGSSASTGTIFGSTSPYQTISIPAGAWYGVGPSSASPLTGGIAQVSTHTAYNIFGSIYHLFNSPVSSPTYLVTEYQMPFKWDGSSIGVIFDWFATTGSPTSGTCGWNLGAIAMSSGTSVYKAITSSVTVFSVWPSTDTNIRTLLSAGYNILGSPQPGDLVKFIVWANGGSFQGLPKLKAVLISYREAVWDGKPR